MITEFKRVKRYVLMSQYGSFKPMYFKSIKQATKHITKHLNGSLFCYHVQKVTLTTTDKNL
jgi:hypothetical protein